MSDAQQGVREMARVTRVDGVVALCFWDHARMHSLAHFWKAAHRVLGVAPVDDQLMGRREGELASLLDGAGLIDIHATEIVATARYQDVDDLWSGYTARIGPIGQYVQTLTPDQLDAVRTAVREDLDEPDRPFTLTAVAWAAQGSVPA